MENIIMPEVVIYNALESIIRYVRKDLNDKKNEQETILYKLVGQNIDGKEFNMNRWNFFKQAKKIFTDEQNLSVNFGFNFEVAKIVSIHIVLPSEEAAESAIGQDEGYGTIIDENGELQKFFTQNFRSNYQIIITSNNSSEILTVYHILKAMLLMIFPHFEIMGLRLNKLSGSDLMFKDDLMPNGYYNKVINLSFNYELKVPQIMQREIIRGVVIDGHLINCMKGECKICSDE